LKPVLKTHSKQQQTTLSTFSLGLNEKLPAIPEKQSSSFQQKRPDVLTQASLDAVSTALPAAFFWT